MGSPEGAVTTPKSPPRRRPGFCCRNSRLSPVGGEGSNPKPHPLFSVLNSEGWRERAIRGLGQISILSWKQRIQSVHTHPPPTPQSTHCRPRELAELSGQPSPISRQTLQEQSVKTTVHILILFQCVEWGQGSWKQSVEKPEMGAPERLAQSFPFCPCIRCVCLETGAWP